MSRKQNTNVHVRRFCALRRAFRGAIKERRRNLHLLTKESLCFDMRRTAGVPMTSRGRRATSFAQMNEAADSVLLLLAPSAQIPWWLRRFELFGVSTVRFGARFPSGKCKV